tara:strand:+ start:418 stop:984 length:567 start_codon:yes stop_codon:yes gene_type:complete
MKKSELKSFIRENVLSTLSEEIDNPEYYFEYLNKLRDSGVTNMFGATPYLRAEFGLDKRTAREILAKWMKSSMNEASAEDIQAAADLNAELEKTIQLKKDAGIEEDIDDDDVDAKAIKQAKGARGKFKKLDLAVKALKSIETEMKSLARKYSAADETEKEKIKNILREKTPKKKELESLVAKLEKDVV